MSSFQSNNKTLWSSKYGIILHTYVYRTRLKRVWNIHIYSETRALHGWYKLRTPNHELLSSITGDDLYFTFWDVASIETSTELDKSKRSLSHLSHLLLNCANHGLNMMSASHFVWFGVGCAKKQKNKKTKTSIHWKIELKNQLIEQIFQKKSVELNQTEKTFRSSIRLRFKQFEILVNRT